MSFRIACHNIHCAMRSAGVPLAFAVAWMFAAATADAAVVYCVASSQGIQNALDKASDGGMNNGKDNHIHIVQGTYGTAAISGGGPFYYSNTASTGDLVIEGGYDSGCATRSPDPFLTQLGGSHVSQVMSLQSVNGDIDVSGLTFQNGVASTDGGGLQVNISSADSGTVNIFDNVFRDNTTSKFGGGLYAASSGSGRFVFVTNNLIVGNSADVGNAGAELIGNGMGVLFYDNTVYQNTTSFPGGVGGIYCGGSGECEVTNNIIWDNSNVGIDMEAAGTMTLDYNDIGSYTGGPFSEKLGNQSVAPKFVDATSGDFHLAGNSTLLGVSPILLGSSIDLDGNTYPARGVQDMGAYEETVFTNGFDELPPE